MGLLNYNQMKFNKIEIEIDASEGEIEEGEDDIKKALKEMGIE